MTKSEWITIAKVLGSQRASAAAGWPPTDDMTNPDALHDRKLMYLAELSAIDKIAVVMAATLDQICSTFDRRHFFRLVSGD